MVWGVPECSPVSVHVTDGFPRQLPARKHRRDRQSHQHVYTTYGPPGHGLPGQSCLRGWFRPELGVPDEPPVRSRF